jgi:hypothetical protein
VGEERERTRDPREAAAAVKELAEIEKSIAILQIERACCFGERVFAFDSITQ